MGGSEGGGQQPTIIRSGVVLGGRYLLSEPLQSGGMAVVWAASDELTHAPVAIKLLHPSLVGTNASQRMLCEASALGRIRHRAAARVLDFAVTHDGVAYLVLELLRGRTLLDLLEERWRLPPREAVALLVPVVGALADAHANGVVHRDVKPANVVLAEGTAHRLEPKLIDFGLALLTASGPRITQDGALVGTPAYVAPEQAQGRGEVDFRADIWSICVVLYHALTGRTPFEGQGPFGVLDAIRTQPPTPIVDLMAGDAALWRVVARGLEKEPTHRWSSAHELGTALATWLRDQGVEEDAYGVSLREEWGG
ncbi:MAG: serine/threonine protein kinase [Polyangiaceae bacterium]|nr:serine/threonine protein kinase [Polyangiaceae bacterium]